MDRLATGEEPDANASGNANENDRLQARSQTAQAAWVSAISYWCEYLTIIDIQGHDDPALPRAS
jgi:hypothetical protein